MHRFPIFRLRFSTTFAALLLGLGCLGLPAPVRAQGQSHFDDPDARFTFSGVEFPAVVDTFIVTRAQRWPDPGAGVGLTYATPVAPVSLDLYVYPVGPEVPDDSLDAALRDAVDQALESIRLYVERNLRDGATYTHGRTDSVTVAGPDGDHHGWIVAGTMTAGSRDQLTLLYLFRKARWLLKYRISYRVEDADALTDPIRRFLRHTLADVTPLAAEP